MRFDELWVQAIAKYNELCSAFMAKYQLAGMAIIDHIGWQCSTLAEYEALRDQIFNVCEAKCWEEQIGGRLISYFKLPERTAFKFDFGSVSYLEVAEPKPGQEAVSGFDHIEICPQPRLKSLGGLLRTFIGKEELTVQDRTTDIQLTPTFKVRISSEPLIEKIKREM